ncbi:MAG: hypothetical protein FD134_2362, partial [Gallionellaceae bacterium]
SSVVANSDSMGDRIVFMAATLNLIGPNGNNK